METKKYMADIEPILLLYGGAEKSISEMTEEEFEQAAKNIRRRAKEKAFSKGLPIYFGKGNKLMAEYPDGRVEEIKKD